MPSFEEKGMAKAAARRAAREAKRLGKNAGNVASGVGKLASKGLFKLIIMNPYIGLALLCILAAFIIYTVYSVNSALDKLLYQYTHLVDTSQQNSKAQFDKKLHYIKVNSDGTTSVVIGLKSEIDAQQLQQAVEDAGGDGTTIDIDINGWYTDVKAGTKASTSKSVFASGSTLAIYDGPPWDVEEGSYIFNYPQARYDTYEMFSDIGVSGNPVNNTNMYSAAVVGGAGQTSRLSANGFDSSTGLKTVDGVVCLNFCPMPTLVDRNWIDNWTQGATCSKDKYQFGTGRYAVILVDKTTGSITDSSTWKYLPLCPNDAKAHTYPWGVVQTNIKITGPSTLQFSRDWSGTSQSSQYNKTYSDGIGASKSIKDALLTISESGYDDEFNPTKNFNAYSWWNHALELYAQGNTVVNAFGNYYIVGIMYFGEG